MSHLRSNLKLVTICLLKVIAMDKRKSLKEITFNRIRRYSCGSGGYHLSYGFVLDGSFRHGEELVAKIAYQ